VGIWTRQNPRVSTACFRDSLTFTAPLSEMCTPFSLADCVLVCLPSSLLGTILLCADATGHHITVCRRYWAPYCCVLTLLGTILLCADPAGYHITVCRPCWVPTILLCADATGYHITVWRRYWVPYYCVATLLGTILLSADAHACQVPAYAVVCDVLLHSA
jgi:hypothetical protein